MKEARQLKVAGRDQRTLVQLATYMAHERRCVGLFAARRRDELLARQMKVAASDDGGCGFGELSAVADKLANALTGSVDWASVEEAMHGLANLVHRIKKADE